VSVRVSRPYDSGDQIPPRGQMEPVNQQNGYQKRHFALLFRSLSL